jgi:SAM-dependent methyltransferase
MALSSERLREIAIELASRPRHEKVRSLVYELLVNGVGASSTELDFERPVPEVRGRIDALLGSTLFEFKSDLRREMRDVETKLPDYLGQRQDSTGRHFVAVATDGATFITYELRTGMLSKLSALETPADKPRDLLAWLSAVVAVSEDLDPTTDIVERELGRSSLAWNLTRQELKSIWDEIGQRPNVTLKRDLWNGLMRRVYGATLNEDMLFFQHTYLTIIAKTMAARVLGVKADTPYDLLSGRPFLQVGIGGVVEPDFFDWLLDSDRGADLVQRISRQAVRFRLEDVQTDVLKGLYESLIDPEQRHALGEYYTPDWLAAMMCDDAIKNPLQQRVLDPACGSGTFIFHAVRLILKAADKAGIPDAEALEKACRLVYGIDIHPVAIQIARVTFLLAMGQKRLKQRPSSLNIPVYMGDSLQWNTRGFMAERDVLIEVPVGRQLLEFPFEVAQDPDKFDTVINTMLDFSHQQTPAAGLSAYLKRNYRFTNLTVDTLINTYNTLCQLDKDGLDHIWGFVARNLVRPIWLSQPEQKADVVIGNPPWLSFNRMDAGMQGRFREDSQSRGLWMGQVAQQQDLSAYFYVRCIELYLKPNGLIAFVMPYAAMTRRQFAGFRTGVYSSGKKMYGHGIVYAAIRFTQAWAFSDSVKPLFPVPSCVLFAGNESTTKKTVLERLPSTVRAAAGQLPKRDTTLADSRRYISWCEQPWPTERKDRVTKGYADDFRQGAIIIPVVLFRAQKIEVGQLGANRGLPLIESRRSNLEKLPWKGVPSLRGNIEPAFLRRVYLGESIAPYRALEPMLAVIPWDEQNGGLLNASEAQNQGYPHLAGWLAQAEQQWARHGSGKRTLKEQLDYYGQLSAQFPTAKLRVVYSKAGTLPAACLLMDTIAITDHKLYWYNPQNKEEGHYLICILNSETTRKMAEHLQSRGQWGARDFDKVMLSLPIPHFDPSNKLHQSLAKAAAHAEKVAAAMRLKENQYFIKTRQQIRAALHEDGIDRKIDKLVATLLRHKQDS